MKKLTIDEIEVPAEMLSAVLIQAPTGVHAGMRRYLSLALLWLHQNPIVPNDEEARDLWNEASALDVGGTVRHCVREWQRRAFLKREPEVPEELREILGKWFDGGPAQYAIKQAYELGKKASAK